ncbi:uncharacterized protein LOC135167865 isoform X2 [Diachasmimorpha longicaudata]|uniref:uncharacterized protein LOC135167865 isoform X2 n=1 Tax=Diachasmimorpha longicaudata TaxID=58733 RepID=UPI0030B89CA1
MNQDHLATCPDYREIQQFRFKTDDKEFHGIVSMEEVAQAHSRPVIGEEDWDNDVYHETYDPMKNSEGQPVVRTLMGASKAKRREFRMRERARMAQLMDEKPTVEPLNDNLVVNVLDEPLRPPKNKNIEETLMSKLRAPRNLTTSSEANQDETTNINGNGKSLPEESPKPEGSGGRKGSKTWEKVPIPRRKPNLDSSTSTMSSLDAAMSKLHIQNYFGALETDKSEDPQEKTDGNPIQPRKIGRCAATFK